MTKQEFAAMTGKSLPAVRKLCDKGRFTLAGFGTFEAVKTSPARTAPIDIRQIGAASDIIRDEPQTAGAVRNAAMANLKAAKTTVEIQILQQRLFEKQEKIEQNFMSDVLGSLLEILEHLKKAFQNCNLTREQRDSINDAISESLKSLERRSSK